MNHPRHGFVRSLTITAALVPPLLLAACGGAEKRLVEHTSARSAPPLEATDSVMVPPPSGRFAIPGGVVPEQHDAETLRQLERPPEMATASSEPLPTERRSTLQVTLVEAEIPRLELAGPYDRHWARLETALSAGGFAVRESRPGEGVIEFRYAEAAGDVRDTEGLVYELNLVRGDAGHRLTVRDAEGGPVPAETALEILEIIRDRL